MSPLLPILLSGLLAAVLIVAMLRFRHTLPMDEPNHRSLHSAPIPRSGGIGIFLGASAGWLLLSFSLDLTHLRAILMAALVLSAFSLLDDWRGLSIGWRFAAQLLAAAWVTALVAPSLPLALVVLAVLSITWMTNLFNFMDGANGLAGGMGLFGFGFYGLAAAYSGDMSLALACACLSAATAGFLLFNFDPAKIFMGDGGSIPMGFLAGALGLLGWQRGNWPLLFPLIVFSPFIVDATITLTRRLLRGEKIWQAHRSHYYQRLIRMGLGHRRTALWEYALMTACGLSAIAIRESTLTIQLPLLLLWMMIYILLATRIDAAWQRYNPD